jgi:hypothetical protein
MEIRDTIQVLAKIRQSIDTWVPRRTTRPDALIADVNDLEVDAHLAGILPPEPG